MTAPGGDQVHEGDAAASALDEQDRGSTSRQTLARRPGFDDVSPMVGVLDEAAFDTALSDDADEALSLLADLVGATDEKLAAQARRLAARVVLDVARTGPVRGRGTGRIRRRPADRAEGDLDVEAGADVLALARATGVPPPLDELSVRTWATPTTAVCLLLDRSGSMLGDRLAAAALAAAACAWRAPDDYSVLAFGAEVIVIKPQDIARPAEAVTRDVFRLRGHGTTNLDLALRTARAQLARSSASRRLTVLLSDGKPTAGPDPVGAARALDELVIIAPAADTDDAEALARAAGARWVPLAGPAGIPAAFARLLAP